MESFCLYEYCTSRDRRRHNGFDECIGHITMVVRNIGFFTFLHYIIIKNVVQVFAGRSFHSREYYL